MCTLSVTETNTETCKKFNSQWVVYFESNVLSRSNKIKYLLFQRFQSDWIANLEFTFVPLTCQRWEKGILEKTILNINNLPTYLPTCLPACLPACLPSYLSTCLSINQSIHLSIHPSIHPPTHPSIRPSIHLVKQGRKLPRMENWHIIVRNCTNYTKREFFW